jgi:hypothetical protein
VGFGRICWCRGALREERLYPLALIFVSLDNYNLKEAKNRVSAFASAMMFKGDLSCVAYKGSTALGASRQPQVAPRSRKQRYSTYVGILLSHYAERTWRSISD